MTVGKAQKKAVVLPTPGLKESVDSSSVFCKWTVISTYEAVGQTHECIFQTAPCLNNKLPQRIAEQGTVIFATAVF